MFGIICFCQNKNVLLQCRADHNKKSMKKNYLFFVFFVLSYYLFIEWDRDQDRYRYRYMDIEMGSGAESGGADGAEAVGMMGLTTIKNK